MLLLLLLLLLLVVVLLLLMMCRSQKYLPHIFKCIVQYKYDLIRLFNICFALTLDFCTRFQIQEFYLNADSTMWDDEVEFSDPFETFAFRVHPRKWSYQNLCTAMTVWGYDMNGKKYKT